MSDHYVQLSFDGCDMSVSQYLVCEAPAAAFCHAHWRREECECEIYSDYADGHDGRPYHTCPLKPGDLARGLSCNHSEPEKCPCLATGCECGDCEVERPGTYRENYCTLDDWFANSGAEGGSVKLPVDVDWVDGEAYFMLLPGMVEVVNA